MNKLLLTAVAAVALGTFAPQAQAGHKHHRDCDHRSYRTETRVYRSYSHHRYGGYYYDYGYRPRAYYRPAYYECRPRYYTRPRVSFFFSF